MDQKQKKGIKFDTVFTQNKESIDNGRIFNQNQVFLNQNLNRIGHWSQKQNAKYYAFLEKFKDKFTQKQERRHWKIFKALSEFIKTRDPSQCRSHHHKMTRKFKSIEQTLEAMKSRNTLLQEKSKKYGQVLQKIDLSAIQQGAFYQAFKQNNIKNQNKINFEKFLLYQNYNLQGRLSMGKQEDIGFLPTQISYCSYENLENNRLQKLPQGLTKQFPSTGLLPWPLAYDGVIKILEIPNEPQISKNSQINQCTNVCYRTNKSAETIAKKFSNNNFSLVPMDSKTKQQKWIQCHYYFLKWIQKLNSLINMEYL